ncbi:MAG: DUF4416 family protein [Chloroflexi bacterium]|nr:DUF4416 family protein [Chloroflexota bacterium]
MGKPAPARPVKVFAGLLTGRPSCLPQARAALEETLGPADYASEVMDFTFTGYYEEEMGVALKRQFFSFDRLETPEKLAEIKLFTNSLEEKWAENGRRLVNLDPGYLNEARVVLASTKDFAHRIYIGQGIYAEITLLFQHKRFEPLPWTYPDFRSEAYHRVLGAMRARYVRQVRASSR